MTTTYCFLHIKFIGRFIQRSPLWERGRTFALLSEAKVLVSGIFENFGEGPGFAISLMNDESLCYTYLKHTQGKYNEKIPLPFRNTFFNNPSLR